MKVWTLVSSAIGAGFTLWLLSAYGFERILSLVAMAGWAIPAVAAFHVTQIVASGCGWRMATREDARRLRGRSYYLFRWIREAINNLLPAAQFGGVVVGTRLIARRGVPLPSAIAGAIVDTTLEFVSQIAFTLLGLGLLFLGPADRSATHFALVAFLVIGALGVGLLAAQWFGLAKLIELAAEKLGKAWGRPGPNATKGLHHEIMALYRAPRRILGGLFFHFAAWVLGGFEIYISLSALGHGSSILACMVIEAFGQALKSAGFAVPASLGVQEGGYVLAGAVFGLPPETGIALSLIKRLRDIVLGLPALAVWHRLEAEPHVADAPSP
ncbi:MAG TPA: flippase-like domain-containing protein [Micropepsaceae bacterium]